MWTTFYPYALVIAIVLAIAYFKFRRSTTISDQKLRLPDRPLPKPWVDILRQRVPFYNRLTGDDKFRFEDKVHVFLLNVQIKGSNTTVTDLDRILIAAGSAIPSLRFDKWHYPRLKEVVVFPERFQIPETDKLASGLMGRGEMNGKMWLSRKALYKGFSDETDHKNVAIHEFIHLIDDNDGFIDGVIDGIIAEADVQHWYRIMEKKIEEIENGKSSIRSYATANPAEFLAVTGEFYFENPQGMRSEHPKLYRLLEKMFNPNANW